jgi:general secretion pathway protein D
MPSLAWSQPIQSTPPANDDNSFAAGNQSSAPPTNSPPPASQGVDKLVAAQTALLAARQAIAIGDVDSAAKFASTARQANIDFQAIGDSPANIEGLIARQNELTKLAEVKHPSFNAAAAEFLLGQSKTLIYYNDFELAGTLIESARGFPVEFKPAADTPDKLASLLKSVKAEAMGEAMGNTPQTQVAAAEPQSGTTPVVSDAKSQTMKLLSQAQLAIDQVRWADANAFVQAAKQIDVPEDQFTADESRPWQLELLVQKGLNRGNTGNVMQTRFEENPKQDQTPKGAYPAAVIQAAYDPASDATRNVQVVGTSDVQAADFTEDGVLQSAKPLPKTKLASQKTQLNIGQLSDEQQAAFRRLQSVVFKERAAAERMLETNPREALEIMTSVYGQVAQSNLDANSQRPLLSIINRDIAEMQKYIEQNLPDIMNQEQNEERKDSVERRQQRRFDVEQQLQKLVEEYNQLEHEERYAEAEVVVRQAQDLAPDSEIVGLLKEKSRASRNYARAMELKAAKERGFMDSMQAAEAAMVGWNYDKTVEFGNLDQYSKNAKRRDQARMASQYDSETERQIWNTLRTQQVQGEYTGTLAEALDQLAQQSNINIVFDSNVLNAAGIRTDQQVNVPIRAAISLKSVLDLLVGSVGLQYIVEHEAIKITTKDAQQSKLVTKTYYIGDLVMPMDQNPDPLKLNFQQPNMNPRGGNGSYNMANSNPMQSGGNNALAMAQQTPNMPGNPFGGGMNYGGGGGGPQMGVPTYASVGGQHFGGVSQADFQVLIQLIENTVHNESWLNTGQGLGTIEAFAPNLSLIVSNTQEIQDEIQELLKKLRELNDVQIVIEVRFITLSDSFFERVGIDFDFAINDNTGLTGDDVNNVDNFQPSAVVGRLPIDPFVPTPNLDLQFLQGSFTAAQPQFGAFTPATAASFGFAILSDIEVFFLIQASKGDQRSNIMQAPTVTMFNGQSASVSDGASRPFVTSVIPVVGDFAVAHQPVITILPDGTNLDVQAVVTDDRRFVRLNLVPFFSQVTDVQTFTFDGTTTTERTSGSVLDDLLDAIDPNGGDAGDEELQTRNSGITIQLPVLSFTTVNTVVSVPDGGTVLMGGIKRMQEGRVENGIPFLSNIPYVNRLFKNVAISHQTSNLMMMVTPRIIIQKEVEEDTVGLIGN